MKKINAAVIVIMVIAAAYAILLLTIGQTNETVLIVWSKATQYQLPFEVSPWWNIVSFPLAIFAIIYLMNPADFAGNEYSGEKVSLSCNYKARFSVYIVTALSLVLTSGVYMLVSWIDFLIPAEYTIGGPLSILIIVFVCFFGCYIIFGSLMSFVSIQFTFIYDLSDEKADFSEYYVTMLAKYAKIGIVKTLPFIIGLSVGLMIRLIFRCMGAILGLITEPRKKAPYVEAE